MQRKAKFGQVERTWVESPGFDGSEVLVHGTASLHLADHFPQATPKFHHFPSMWNATVRGQKVRNVDGRRIDISARCEEGGDRKRDRETGKQEETKTDRIFDRGTKIIQWRKEWSLQQMVPGQLDIHMPKNEVRLLPHSIFRN